ncbi:MAG: hypothetical protein Kow0020_10110 [Wenzhouxiangellaceae bacterium]
MMLLVTEASQAVRSRHSVQKRARTSSETGPAPRPGVRMLSRVALWVRELLALSGLLLWSGAMVYLLALL